MNCHKFVQQNNIIWNEMDYLIGNKRILCVYANEINKQLRFVSQTIKLIDLRERERAMILVRRTWNYCIIIISSIDLRLWIFCYAYAYYALIDILFCFQHRKNEKRRSTSTVILFWFHWKFSYQLYFQSTFFLFNFNCLLCTYCFEKHTLKIPMDLFLNLSEKYSDFFPICGSCSIPFGRRYFFMDWNGWNWQQKCSILENKRCKFAASKNPWYNSEPCLVFNYFPCKMHSKIAQLYDNEAINLFLLFYHKNKKTLQAATLSFPFNMLSKIP